jgi:hypothetical protein
MSLSDAPQVRSLTELAEAAAAAGDCIAAARHLRNLADLQEGELGPAHPDLANTLNNLAVVSERAGDLDGAEAAFRRAEAIARIAFAPDHPFVTTSKRNLREFCEAHRRSLELAAVAASPDAPAEPAAPAVVQRSLPSLIVVGAIAGVVAAGGLVWVMASRGGDALQPAVPDEKPETTEARPADTGPSTPIVPATAPPSADSGLSETSSVDVVNAAVCADFAVTNGQWQCTPIAGTAPAGRLAFYTRVKVAKPTTVEHRWYRGEQLVHRVTLRVSPNPGAGYRTFSRNTVVSAPRWRVELRADEGTVVYEQRFEVP